jgi:cobalamin biosynthesis protein CobD/CbiB
MTNWMILATPYFHAWIGVVALTVLTLVVLTWRSLTQKIKRQELLLAKLYSFISKQRAA